MIGAGGNSVAQKFKYNGIELEESLGLNLYEMDFRQYDPAIARFTSIDPLAEERDWLTSYNFVQNNPISRVDPSGLLDDLGLDTETGQLILLRETEGDTDTIFTGEITGMNDKGDYEFKKDGNSKTFSKKASNIKEVTSTEDFDGNAKADDGASSKGLVFNEGFQDVGEEVMEFISFNTDIELSGWGFENNKGDGLFISRWNDNDIESSVDEIASGGDYVSRPNSSKSYGKKTFKVHIHPGPTSSSNPSGPDKRNRNKGANGKYPHYIISKNEGKKSY